MSDERPRSWVAARLDELGHWLGGGTPSKAEPRFWTNGSVPWVSPKDMKTPLISDAEDKITNIALENSATNLIPAGAVLIVTRSGILAHSLPVAVTTVPVAINQDLKALVPHQGISPLYVAAALRADERGILARCVKHGTTVHSVESSRLREYRIPISPTAEQERIVAATDALFADLDAAEESLRKAEVLIERYDQANLHAITTGAITAHWRNRRGQQHVHNSKCESGLLDVRRETWSKIGNSNFYKEPRPPSSLPRPAQPTGWDWVTVDQLIAADPMNGVSIKGSDNPPGICALKLNAITSDGINYDAVRYIPLDRKRAERITVAHGDFLVSRANGTKTFCGRAALCSTPSVETVFPDTMIRFRFLSLPKLSHWVDLVWNSPLVRNQIESRAKTSAGIWKISQEDIRSICVPLPPSEERVEILKCYSEICDSAAGLISTISIQLENISRLRQAILHSAFTGKLVPQDPNDEPASVLLERIRAARATVTAARPERKSRAARRRASA